VRIMTFYEARGRRGDLPGGGSYVHATQQRPPAGRDNSALSLVLQLLLLLFGNDAPVLPVDVTTMAQLNTDSRSAVGRVIVPRHSTAREEWDEKKSKSLYI